MKSYLKIVIAIFLIYTCQFSHAQWVKLNTDSSHSYSGIHFLNKDTGFVCGQMDKQPYNSIILRTSDGGDNWDTTSFMGIYLTDIQFVNDSVGFSGGQDGAFYITTDLGNNWNYLGICVWLDDISNFYFFNENSGISLNFFGTIRLMDPNLSGSICINYYNTTAINYFPGTGEIDFLNSMDGYIAGGYGKFLKTIDGGTNWTYFNCDSSIYIFGAKMTDQNHAVVVGNNGNYSVTNDGGINWTFPVSMSQHHHHILDVDFYNNQYGFAVGGYSTFGYPSSGPYPIGSIWSTSNGGNTWTLVDSSYSDQLTDIHIVNDSLAFAVGLSGLVLRNQSHFSTINNIQENNENINLSIFPNPFSDEINIYLPSTTENLLCIFDLSGKFIYSDKFSGNYFRFNATHLLKGIYFIKIISDKGVATKKLVKIE